jgi:nitroimidazol reductase NimA-like FMN-containing flavoprotein (pyridoxamine 5'-phosphate oxidase superfamily)
VDELSDLFLGRLVELDETECIELLQSRRVGRAAYCDDQGPVVLPVNHQVVDGAVVFRIPPYSEMAAHLNDRPASYQVDDFDEFRESGWSVLVRGTATYVDPDHLPIQEQRPAPWPRGQRTLNIRITPTTITGRRLLPG